MKKGLKKLILSGAALAAVGATLGTSTYAWYTTNPTVSANNIVGASSDTGSSSIFISLDHENWSSVVDLSSVSLSTALVPVQYSAAGTFTKINPETGAATTPAAGGTDVASFTLYFKSSKVAADNAQSIYLKTYSIANTTTAANLKPADNLLYTGTAGTSHGVDTNKSQYYVNFTKALSMAVYNADTDNGYDGAFTISDAARYNATQSTYAVPSGKHEVSTGDAHGYYDAVMPTALASTAVKTAAGAYDKNAIAVCPTDGQAYCTVIFYVYLDGGSTFCYDACQGQTFKLNLTFTSNEDDAYEA